MKKIAKLSIIMLLIIFCLTVNVYAKPNCNINMITETTEIVKGQELAIDVKLSNIESEKGIIAIEGTLEYDKDCLTLSKMQGQNDWSSAIDGISYNPLTGKFVIDKDGLAKKDEVILKIIFTVNSTDKKSTTVKLKDIIVADGTVPAKISEATKTITIKEEQKPDTKLDPDENQKPDTKPNPDENQKPDTKPNPDENQKPDTKPNPDENQKPDTNTTTDEEQKPNTNQTTGNTNNIATGELSQTGNDNSLLIILIILAVIVAITSAFVYSKRKNNKKTRR